MYKIYQGGNTPIHIRFLESASNFTYISAGIYSKTVSNSGTLEKHWDKAQMTISGADVYLPLTQAETKAFKKGKASILIKYRKSSNPVEIIKEIEAEVVERHDREIALGAN